MARIGRRWLLQARVTGVREVTGAGKSVTSANRRCDRRTWHVQDTTNEDLPKRESQSKQFLTANKSHFKKHDITQLIFLRFSVGREGSILTDNFIKLLYKIIDMQRTTEKEKERRYRCLSNILGYPLDIQIRESCNIYKQINIIIISHYVYL